MKTIGGIIAISVVAAISAPLYGAASEVRVYVTNSAGDSVEAIDPETNKVVQVISGIPVPHGINFSPDGRRIYVSSEAENVLDVVDRQSGKMVSKVALSGHPNNIAVTKDGGRVLVAISNGDGVLDVIDTATLKLTKSIPTKGPLHNVYVTPDGKYAVAGSIPGKVATIIDLETEKPAWEVHFDAGVRPMAIEANPDGSTKRIFAQLSHFEGFAVVDFATRQEVARIKLPVASAEFEIPPARAGAPSHGIGVAPDGRTLWVDSDSANAVFAYSLPDLRLIGHVSLPVREVANHPAVAAIPNWLSFTPDSSRLYVSDSALDSVSVIDTQALKQVAVVPVGEMPKRSNTLVLP
jgi:YVTN family beta-propeller protein